MVVMAAVGEAVITALFALICANIPAIMVVMIAPTTVIIATITAVLLKTGLLFFGAFGGGCAMANPFYPLPTIPFITVVLKIERISFQRVTL